MKLTTLAMAVATTVAFGHSAQARVHYRSHHQGHHLHRREARRHGFAHYRFARRDYGNGFEAPRNDFAWRENADAFEPSQNYLSRRSSRRRFEVSQDRYARRGSVGARPSAWCGWEMRQLVGGDPGPSYNLARNWAHWGHAGPAGVGAVVVWPHHVGKIVGREEGQWVIKSGNDGHRLRTRPRSIAGAIAIRWG